MAGTRISRVVGPTKKGCGGHQTDIWPKFPIKELHENEEFGLGTHFPLSLPAVHV